MDCDEHGPSAVGAALSPDVLVNGRPMGRGGDRVDCGGPTANLLITGVKDVRVNDRPASRLGEHCMHGGVVTEGSADVWIGGASEGMLIGADRDAALLACRVAAEQRRNQRAIQNYGNCGLESARQLINRGREVPVTEDELQNDAISRGLADDAPEDKDRGGTSVLQREMLLHDYGVESEMQPATRDHIAGALAERKGVVSHHRADALWSTSDAGDHVVLVTGAKYDSEGELIAYRVNDTGSFGGCAALIERDRFEGSLRATAHGGVPVNVTKKPAW